MASNSKGKKVVKSAKQRPGNGKKSQISHNQNQLNKNKNKNKDNDSMSQGGASRGRSRNEESSSSSSSSSGSESESEIDINFELFNMAESDYHSVKQYLVNLFGAGDHGVDLVALTTFITESLADHLGTCIKTDGESSDPFGFITGFTTSFIKSVADGAFHQTALKSFTSFLKEKLKQQQFDIDGFMAEPKNVLIFQERLINVPTSLAPPLYKQFIDDWSKVALEDAHNFGDCKRVLLLTPTYKEIISKLDQELGVDKKTERGGFGSVSSGICYYYEEIESLKSFSETSYTFSVNTGHETSDSRRAFSENGIEPGRQVFILTWSNFLKYVQQLNSLYTE